MKLSKYIFLTIFIYISNTVLSQKKEVNIEPSKLSENVFMVKGRGGNIAVLKGDDGTLIIDSQFAPLTPKIIDAVKNITPKPINYLINTHWHGDHTGGNENLGKEDVVIVSHKNVRERMSTDQLVRGRTKKASPKIALPVITFEKDITFHYNNETIFVTHVHNAHTDGDALVYFMNNNVLHTGDAFFQGKFPYIDLDSGGSINGYIAGIKIIISLCDDETKILPGHGKVSSKKELKSYLSMLTTIKKRVEKEIENGKTETDIINNKSLTQDYVSFSGWINEERILATIYKSLKK